MSSVDVVIPAINEANHLPGLLRDLRALAAPVQVVVVDAGSTDATTSVATAGGARVVQASRGRAVQMNAGAATSDAEWICFLHADVRLGEDARRDLDAAVGNPRIDAAVWRLGIDATGWWFRLVEYGARVRDRFAGLPYGDQGLLVRRTVFERVGGFPAWPLMEDVGLMRELHQRGIRPHRFSSPLLVSSRRWVREGRYLTSTRNVALLTMYSLGVPPSRLARWYPPHHR